MTTPPYFYHLCGRNVLQQAAPGNSLSAIFVQRFCSQNKSTFTNLESSQTLGSSREPPAFTFFDPNSRYGEKSCSDKACVKAARVPTANRPRDLSFIVPQARDDGGSEAALQGKKKRAAYAALLTNSIPPILGLLAIGYRLFLGYTGASVRPPNPSACGNRASSGRLSTGVGGIGGGGFIKRPLLMISRTWLPSRVSYSNSAFAIAIRISLRCVKCFMAR